VYKTNQDITKHLVRTDEGVENTDFGGSQGGSQNDRDHIQARIKNGNQGKEWFSHQTAKSHTDPLPRGFVPVYKALRIVVSAV